MINVVQAPLSPFTSVPGWQSRLEQRALVEYARLVPENGVIVELGSEAGQSASLFCYGSHRSVTLNCVDLFPDSMAQNHTHNLVEAGFGTRNIIRWKGDSAAIGKQWTGDIDLCFIDADHHYEAVKRDIAAWIPHVRVNGFALFHDCACATNLAPHEQHYEVQQAVNEWSELSTLSRNPPFVELPSVDSLRVFRRLK